MLNEIWFLLLGVLLIGYAVLDGFDLGVGILHPFVARNDKDRRILMNAIGPVWDGNEVWLVTFGGAMFAAFPNTYASVFPAFYTAFMLLLCALIFRAVSMEFRSKQPSAVWRACWDYTFFLSSTVIALLAGVAVGNMVQGLAINELGDYQGTFFSLLNPFSLLTGLMVVALFAMHGGIFLNFKTGDALLARVGGSFRITYGLFALFFVLVSLYAILLMPNATTNFKHYPIAALVPLINVASIIAIPVMMARKRPGAAFLASGVSIASLIGLFGLALFPNMVHSTLNPAYSLNIYNAASSQKTLGIMLIIACIGMPLVLGYTFIIYRIFKGKVELDHASY